MAIVKRSKVVLLYSALCLIWGTTWYFLKVSLESTPPLFGSGLRFCLSGVILWGIFFWKREKLPRSCKAFSIYLQFALFNFTIGFALTYWATQFIYSNLSALVWAGFPLVVTLMAHFALPEERLSVARGLSVLMGTAGVTIILLEGGRLGGPDMLRGIGLVALAVVFAAWPNIYLKRNLRIVKPIHLNAVCQSTAGVILLSLSAIFETQRSMVWNRFNIFAVLYLAIMGSVVVWMIYIWLYDHIPVTQIAYVAFFPPVIATVIGWLVLDEKLSLPTLLGAVLVLLGIGMVNRRGYAPAKRL